MMRKKKNKFLLLGLFLSYYGQAQQFHHTALMDRISKDGFYSIPITPVLSGYLKTDLSDIRIADEKGQWVPHLTNWSLKNTIIHNVYVELPVIKKENTDAATIIVAGNTGKRNLSNLFVIVKNTSASRKVVLSGSDDQKNWFTITDSLFLKASMILENKPAFNIEFPVVNYNYFKIALFNGESDPLNIQQVMSDVPGDSRITETFIENPASRFTQKDTAGFSVVRIENPGPFHFNRFKISVSSPRFFDRRARLYHNAAKESINSILHTAPTEEYVLSSRNADSYETPVLKSKVFYLLIENGDNPPLQITGVETNQVKKELIAYLEKGHDYKLFFDDSAAKEPDYDLKKFRDIIPDSLVQLSMDKIITVAPAVTDKTEIRNDRKQWIWPAIIAVILLLSYFTRSLIRDMKKRNNS
ncbi:MAG: hypothetical protein ABUT20_39060 [Bacteroidota bacterium]